MHIASAYLAGPDARVEPIWEHDTCYIFLHRLVPCPHLHSKQYRRVLTPPVIVGFTTKLEAFWRKHIYIYIYTYPC